MGAAAAAIAAVTIGVLALGGDDDGASPPSTTAGAIPTDPFFEVLPPPSDVVVAPLGDGSFQVSYVVPDDVASVEIAYTNGASAERIVSNASPAVVEFAGTTLCVTLRSIGSAGRVSTDFGPICSG